MNYFELVVGFGRCSIWTGLWHDGVGRQSVAYRLRQQTHYFCSEHCLQSSRLNPAPMRASGVVAPAPHIMRHPTWLMPVARRATVLRHNLHLSHASRGGPGWPGSCPKCGMALEAARGDGRGGESRTCGYEPTPVGEHSIRPAGVSSWRCSLILAPQWLPGWLTMHAVQWLEFLLATPVVLWEGGRSSCAAGSPWCPGNLNMFTLIRAGCGRRLDLQRCGPAGPGCFHRRCSTPAEWWRSISRPRP